MSGKIFILALFLLTFDLSAQEKDKGNKYKIFDEDYFYKGRPAIDISYGQTGITWKNSGISFDKMGLIELKLGYTYSGKSKYSKYVVRFRDNYGFGSYIDENIRTSSPSPSSQTTWRFGFGSSTGYGYKLGNRSAILLYNSNNIDWTRYDMGPIIELDEYGIGIDKRALFNQTFRFGTGTEAGIILPIGGIINFQMQFDRSLVFPRHLVWKHLGSVIIEALGQSALDGFIHAVFKASPESGPVINFLLKNGLAFGLYELRRTKMNWPFESAEPMLFDSFKGGINIVF